MDVTTNMACPELAKLGRHARSDLAPNDTVRIDRHLASCPTCLDQYIHLRPRTLVAEIPGCHIVKEIGRGRFGVVYKAWWLSGRPHLVALKVLNCPGEMERSRFEREIAVLRKLDSPLIVKCLDSGSAGEALYFIMEYVEGVHLDQYMTSHASNLDAKLAVLQRVCRAVADAHTLGVVHRDLKPKNIIVDSGGQPHILDFGICEIESGDWSSWERLTITKFGDVIGTLKYMSPEQAWGGVSSPVDEKSDLWSLGILLHECVTNGGYPYSLQSSPDRPTHEALLERIRRELPTLPKLSALPRGRDLEILLERCLAWEPKRRIDSAASLADDIEKYRGGKRIATKPLSTLYRFERLVVGAAAHSRWMFSATFIAAVGITLWVTTLLLNVSWRVTGSDYQGQDNIAAGWTQTGSARDAMLVIGVTDDTAGAVVQFASENNIAGVSPIIKSWRGVHGHLMERLARASPRTMVWDFYFRTPQSGDAGFVSGIEAMEAAGVPVVLASLTYREDGTPDLSPGLTGAVKHELRHGAIVARDMVKLPGEFVMAIKHGQRAVIPSLALTTLASLLHPEARLELDWRGRGDTISTLYKLEPDVYLRERDRIAEHRVTKAPRSKSAVRVGDLLACSSFELDEPRHWEERTVPYQKLLTATDDELEKLVKGKILLVGDLRMPRPLFAADRHRVKYGMSVTDGVPGCYLLGDAIAGLLDRRYMKSAFPLAPLTYLCMLLAAALGCVVPIPIARWGGLHQPAVQRLFWCGVVGLAVACFVGMAAASTRTTVHLAMVGFSMLAPMAGALWVEFARNRHRILDRKRRAIDSLELSTGGTVTLAAMRENTLQETR